MKDRNYVIIGNSAAGISAAEAIREIDITGKITIISQEDFPAYSHLLISDYLKNKVVLDNIFYKDKSFFQRNNINTVIGVKTQKIDTNTHTVLLSTGEQLKYDKLLLATGSIPFIPNIKSIKDKQNCYTFSNMQSSCDIRNAVNNNTDAVIIGGGLIGLKAAEILSKICKSVTVCELSNRLLASILDKSAGDLIGKHIKKHGINYYTKNTVIEAVCKDNKITGVILKDGRQLNCSILIMAVGARPNIELAKQMGVDIGRGIKTNKRQMTSILDVYAAGDCTESIDILDNSVKTMSLWPNAVMQGKIAGNAMAGGNKCFDGAFAMNTIDFFGFNIVTCGLINASEEDGYISTITSNDMRYRKFVIKDNKLKGYILIGDINRAGIYTDLIRKGIPLDRVKWDNSAPISNFTFNPIQRKKRFGYYPPDMETAHQLCPDLNKIVDIIFNQDIPVNNTISS